MKTLRQTSAVTVAQPRGTAARRQSIHITFINGEFIVGDPRQESSFISRQVECCHSNFCFPLCVATSSSVYVVKTWKRRLLIAQMIGVLQENKPQKCPSLWRRLWRRVERRTCLMWRCVTEAFPTCWTFQDCVRTAHTVSQPARNWRFREIKVLQLPLPITIQHLLSAEAFTFLI